MDKTDAKEIKRQIEERRAKLLDDLSAIREKALGHLAEDDGRLQESRLSIRHDVLMTAGMLADLYGATLEDLLECAILEFWANHKREALLSSGK